MSIRSLWMCAVPALASNPLFTCGPTRQKLQGMEQELQSKSLNCQAELYNFFQLVFPPSDFRVFAEVSGQAADEEISASPTSQPSPPTPSPSTTYWLQLCSNCQKLAIQFTEATTHYTWELCFRDFQRGKEDNYIHPEMFAASNKLSKIIKKTSPPVSLPITARTFAPSSAPSFSPTHPVDCAQLQDLHTSLTNMVHEDERVLTDLTKAMRQGLERMRETLADRTEARRTINMSTFVQCSGYQPLIEFETDVVNRGLDLVVALETEMKDRACPVRTSEVMAQWWGFHRRFLLLFALSLLVGCLATLKCCFAKKLGICCFADHAEGSAWSRYGSVGCTNNRSGQKKKNRVTWATVLALARSPTSSRHMSSPEPPRRFSPSLSPWTSPEADTLNLGPASDLPSPEDSPVHTSTTTLSVSMPTSSNSHSPVFGFLIQQPSDTSTGPCSALRPPSPPLRSEKALDDPSRLGVDSISPLSSPSMSSSSVSPRPGNNTRQPRPSIVALGPMTTETTTSMTLMTMTMTVSTTKPSPIRRPSTPT